MTKANCNRPNSHKVLRFAAIVTIAFAVVVVVAVVIIAAIVCSWLKREPIVCSSKNCYYCRYIFALCLTNFYQSLDFETDISKIDVKTEIQTSMKWDFCENCIRFYYYYDFFYFVVVVAVVVVVVVVIAAIYLRVLEMFRFIGSHTHIHALGSIDPCLEHGKR